MFERGVMKKGEGLDVLEERMKCLDPVKYESYKFLGIEQNDKIQTKVVLGRITKEMKCRLKEILGSKLCDKFVMKAINTRVIPVSAYAMNVCMLSRGELHELNMVIKRKLRKWKVHGKQASDERLYLRRSKGGRGRQQPK